MDDWFWNCLVGEVYGRQKWCKFTECNLQRRFLFLYFNLLCCFLADRKGKKATFCTFAFFWGGGFVGDVTLIYFGLFSEDTVRWHKTRQLEWTKGRAATRADGSKVFSFALKSDLFCA